jgi:hypothetical protein
MLPQLVFLAAFITMVWFGFRWVGQEIARVDERMRRLQRILERVRSNRIPRLQLDEATGLYIPAKF